MSEKSKVFSKNQFLLNYRKNVTSQFGEDGIIEKIFEIIPEQNHWCVECGAGDGKALSNSFNLITLLQLFFQYLPDFCTRVYLQPEEPSFFLPLFLYRH